MSDDGFLDEREHKLAWLLQSSLDFAFRRMSEGQRLIPFATRVVASGAVDHFRLAGEETTAPLAEIYDRVSAALAVQAFEGNVQAVALVAPVQGKEEELGQGFFQAIRVHLEMPAYARVVFQPYRIDAGGEGEKSKLALGNLVAEAAEHVVFGGDGPEETRTIFSLT